MAEMNCRHSESLTPSHIRQSQERASKWGMLTWFEGAHREPDKLTTVAVTYKFAIHTDELSAGAMTRSDMSFLGELGLL